MSIQTAKELAAAAEAVARNYKTLYILGCIGAPMTARNKDRYCNNLDYNRDPIRSTKIKSATANTFGFDCVCLIKSLLWGWEGDTKATYGGALYESYGVPDIGANQMIKVCKDVTTDFSSIEVGEAVWFEGHIGLYIGNGLAVECTPKWSDGVQITAVHNIGKKSGYNGRSWTKHGKLPYVEYTEANESKPEPAPKPAADFSIGLRTLNRGDQGEDVRALQILLNGRGYNGDMGKPDGIFGPRTEGAVKLYQKAKGLEVDGIAGPATLGSLLGV